MSRVAFALAFFAGYAKADLAVYCVNVRDPTLFRSGGFEEYKNCLGDICTCYAYELLCLKRAKDKFTLQSLSYAEAA